MFIVRLAKRRPVSSGKLRIPRFKSTYLERAVAPNLAEQMLNNVERNNEALMGTPLSVIGDPALNNGVEWMADIGEKPQMSYDEMVTLANIGDPFGLVEKDISALAGGIKHLLGSDHPVLESCAKYFFDQEKGGGKTIRPTMVLAVSYALNVGRPASRA